AAELRNQLAGDTASGAPRQAPYLLEQVAVPAEADLPQLRFDLSERVRKDELTGILEIGPKVLEPVPIETALKIGLADFKRGEADPEVLAPLEPYFLRYQTNRPSYFDFPKWAEKLVSMEVQSLRAQQAKVAPAA